MMPVIVLAFDGQRPPLSLPPLAAGFCFNALVPQLADGRFTRFAQGRQAAWIGHARLERVMLR